VKVGATLLVLLAALAVSGCGSSSKSGSAVATTTAAAPPPKAKPTQKPAQPAAAPADGGGKCLDVSDRLVSQIEKNIVLDGAQVTHAQAVDSPASPGLYFVTARIQGGGANGSLATFETRGLAGGKTIYAVDAMAAEISLYGSAVTRDPELTVDFPGAYKSRVCVAGPGAPRGVTAPIIGAGKPAGS
jgi:hypothetical protein